MKAKEIIDRVRVVLNDADGTRWPDAELIDWVNDGCLYIVSARPAAYAPAQEVTLVAGTRQSITTQNPPGLRLLSVVRNVPSGRAIRLVDRSALDSRNPNWHSQAAGPTVNYFIDAGDPKTFYVYPPAIAGARVEAMYSRAPQRVAPATADALALSLDDTYFDPLLNFVLFRAYSKDADYAANANLAASYRGLCDTQLGSL